MPGRRILGPVLALAWGLGLAAYPLFESTEGRYASVAWTMAHGGSWIEPSLNGSPLFTKPPLAYWSAAVALGLLPDAEWAVRLPATLMLLLCALLTRELALALGLDSRRAGWAAVLAALSPLAVTQGRMTTSDIFLWGGVLAAYLGILDAARPRVLRAILLGVGLATGFLAKGHMVLFWVAVPIGLWILTPSGRSHRSRILVAPSGLVLFLVLTAPWFAVVLHRHPDLVGFWLGRETVDRVLTTVHDRAEPWWYYLPQLPLLMLPWWPELRRGIRRRVGHGAPRSLWTVWILVPLVVLSLAGSKRPNYLLPLVTPLALLAAGGILEPAGRSLRWRTGIWAGVVLVVPFLIGIFHWSPPTRDLVHRAARLERPLAAFRIEPTSLVFYHHGPVPVLGEDAPAFLSGGGLILTRAGDRGQLEALAGRTLEVALDRQGRILVGEGPVPGPPEDSSQR